MNPNGCGFVIALICAVVVVFGFGFINESKQAEYRRYADTLQDVHDFLEYLDEHEAELPADIRATYAALKKKHEATP